MFTLPSYRNFSSTADLFDAAPDRVRMCNLPWRHFGGKRRFAGPCTTILAADFPVLIADTLAEPGCQRILVIDGRAIPDCACLGDILAQRAADNGWAGVVVAGLIRDSAAIAGIPIGVVALHTTAKRPFGQKPAGERDVELELGGIAVKPGDSVYVDEDAVVVI